MVEKERFGWEALGYSPLCCEPLSAAGEVAVEAKVQVSVQGRLKSHAAFWLEELDPSEFVADIVTSRYRLPFIALPDPVFFRRTIDWHLKILALFLLPLRSWLGIVV